MPPHLPGQVLHGARLFDLGIQEHILNRGSAALFNPSSRVHDDSAEVTAAFNLILLDRLRRDSDADWK